MVVNRRHTEDALAAQLERTDLQDNRQGFHDENAAHNHQQEFLAQQYGDNAQRAAERQRTDIAHKDLRRVGVEPQETQARADNRRTDDNQLAGVTQIRNMQIVGEVHVPGGPRHQREAGCDEDGRHNRQAVEAVGQVDRIAGTDDDEVSQQDVKQSQLRHHVFKEWHYQLGRRGVFPRQIQRERYAQRNHRHPEILPAGNQALGVFAHDFTVIIDKPDDAVAD